MTSPEAAADDGARQLLAGRTGWIISDGARATRCSRAACSMRWGSSTGHACRTEGHLAPAGAGGRSTRRRASDARGARTARPGRTSRSPRAGLRRPTSASSSRWRGCRPTRSSCSIPKVSAKSADLFWVPEHDTLRGANVITTLTSPHSFSQRRLAELRAHVPDDIAGLPRPRVAVMLGGPNGDYRYTRCRDRSVGRRAAVACGARRGADDHAVAAHASRGEGSGRPLRCRRRGSHLGWRGGEPVCVFPRPRGCLDRSGRLREHDGRSLRDRPARVRVRAGRRLAQVLAVSCRAASVTVRRSQCRPGSTASRPGAISP